MNLEIKHDKTEKWNIIMLKTNIMKSTWYITPQIID